MLTNQGLSSDTQFTAPHTDTTINTTTDTATSTQPDDSISLDESQNALARQREFEGLLRNAWAPFQNLLDRFLNSQLPSSFQPPETSNPTAPAVSDPASPSTADLLTNNAVQEIQANPSRLEDGPVDIQTAELQLEPNSRSPELPNGRLAESSQMQVNELLSELSESLGVEVHAGVSFSDDGSAQLRLTAGSAQGVSYAIAPGTVYSAHTHLSGILSPTPTDLRNNVPQAEDAVVVDGSSLIYS